MNQDLAEHYMHEANDMQQPDISANFILSKF